ncbi:Uncharacterized membrane protein [Clostridium amylolyticum]|uniref:Uncharacterized membrane protein n=1 Tax=Clostridium amylolyticum TaxID=1121298 RepID=A0A1M6KTH9_9CLOT|nr:putative ABC transporter permease [Clostridium amylolyticum]SHJ62164.1 Uncharacterized membrane protein [Clostridium amylolyticum]
MFLSISGFYVFELILLLMIYSIFGWMLEVTYAFSKKGTFVNRGFLYGPLCPIYGFGMLSLLVTIPSESSILYIFIVGMMVTSLVEYITGAILEHFFNTKWWDYTNNFLNVKGRICLSFSLAWGIISIIAIKVIQPFVYSKVNIIPDKYKIIISYTFLFCFIIDLILTIISLNKFNEIFTELSEVELELKNKYASLVGKAINKSEEIEISLKELKEKYNRILNKLSFNHRRLIKAFPGIKSKKFNAVIKDIQNRVQKNKRA